MPNTKLEWALWYQSKGFYVLPMRDKQPMIKFADQPAMTEEQIREWWTKHPDANIAIRTINFLVIDVDRGHADGVDGLKSLQEFGHADWFKDTLKQQTASGGIQLFYAKPKDKEVKQNIGWLPGVDVKAHVNNYVIVPPSTIPVFEKKTVRGVEIEKRVGVNEYRWLNQNKIVEVGISLLKAINPPHQASVGNVIKAWQPTGKSKTAELFELVANGLGDNGGRNNTLSRLIGGLLFRDVDIDIAIKLAVMANDNTAEPLSKTELRRTVESMIGKEFKRRGIEI